MPAATRREADDLIIAALAAGKTVADAAQAAGVCPRTVRRRRSDPAFAARVRRARGELLGEATGKLVGGLAAAVLVLQQLLVDDDPAIRLKAADKLLTHAMRASELVDLEARVAELERGEEDPDDLADDDDPEGEDDEPAEGEG